MKFVILNHQTGSYWSNTSGWTDLYSCTKFTLEESHQIDKPLEGVWVSMRAAKNLRDGLLEV